MTYIWYDWPKIWHIKYTKRANRLSSIGEQKKNEPSIISPRFLFWLNGKFEFCDADSALINFGVRFQFHLNKIKLDINRWLFKWTFSSFLLSNFSLRLSCVLRWTSVHWSFFFVLHNLKPLIISHFSFYFSHLHNDIRSVNIVCKRNEIEIEIEKVRNEWVWM